MEAIIHSKLSEEVNPPGADAVHGAVRVECILAERFTLQFCEQRDKRRGQWHGKRLAPLRFWEVDQFAVQVHVAQEQAGIAQSTAGVPSDAKHNAHPFGLLFQRLHNHRKVVRLYLWFLLGVFPWDANAVNRVAVGEAHCDSVAHKHAQKLHFFQGSVATGATNATLALGWAGAPEDVKPCGFPGEFAWVKNLAGRQERGERLPAVGVGFEIGGVLAVANLNQFRHPHGESVAVAAQGSFISVGLPEQVVGLAGLSGIVPAQARGLGGLPGGCSVADVPERGLWALKQPRHGVTVGYSWGRFSCAGHSVFQGKCATINRRVPLVDSTRKSKESPKPLSVGRLRNQCTVAVQVNTPNRRAAA